ncbi:hypothetical protein ACX93W_01830 [Paenibacillus sp. CAU 1782]
MTRKFNPVEIPLVELYIATDAQRRLRLSADVVKKYELDAGNRVTLGYDATEKAIAIRPATNSNDPTAANIDKRGYISAGRFYSRTKLDARPKKYIYFTEQDGWFIFVAEEVNK